MSQSEPLDPIQALDRFFAIVREQAATDPKFAASLKPSPRGELEITDLNRVYLDIGELNVERLGRGFAWLDTGTPASLVEAAEYVRVVEQRQGQRIACLEEIAFTHGWIDAAQLREAADKLAKSGYGAYLEKVLRDAQS